MYNVKLGEVGKYMDFKFFKRCLHTTVSFIFILAMVHGIFLVAFAKEELKSNDFLNHGWKCKELFLSLWVMAIQYIYFGIYSAIDFIDVYSSKRESLLKLQDHMNNIASYLLFTIVFPLSSMIFLLFWSFYIWDRDLIYPRVMDDLLPPWVNHVIHTLPVPLSIIYMMTSNKIEPSKLSTLTGLVTFLGVYSYVFFSFYSSEGKYVYLVLNTLTPTQLKWILCFSVIGPVCFLFLGYKLNASIDYIKKHSSLLLHS